MEINVECYSGYQAEERPKRFHIQSRTVEVCEIVSRWTSPGYRHFKVKGDDNSLYTLQLDVTSWRWELT